MNILSTFVPDPSYPIIKHASPDDQVATMFTHITTAFRHLDLEECFNYLVKYIEHIDVLMKIVDFDIIVRLYQKYGFMSQYLSLEYIDSLVNHHHVKYVLDTDKHLFSIKDHFNDIHNYSMRLYLKRLRSSDLNIPDHILNNYYFGSNMINDIGDTKKYNQIANKQIGVQWFIYPKNEQTIGNCLSISNLWAQLDNQNIKFIIFRRIVDLNFMLKNQLLVGDLDNIYATPLGYHQLANNQLPVMALPNHNGNGNRLYSLHIYKSGRNTPMTKPYINPETNKITHCYNCKKQYQANWTFGRYKLMCWDCGIYNYRMERETCDLTGNIAFVTGIRHTIGFAIAIKLLRMNCTVIGTSRFPAAALYNYQQEPDYDVWHGRLIICQCDFLNKKSVFETINLVKSYRPHIIINNACQTIRPTRDYYRRVLDIENKLSRIIQGDSVDNSIESLDIDKHEESTQLVELETDIAHVNKWSYIRAGPREPEFANIVIPVNFTRNVKDPTLDPVVNSWTLQLESVGLPEMLEVSVINQITPTLMIQNLIGCMQKPAVVIQVSAKEGTFNSNKTGDEGTHAHTNMCKAAMNMLVRSELERREVDMYYYACDPGYCSGIGDYDYPLSIWDSAARVIYPVVSLRLGRIVRQGHLKNYKVHVW